MDAQTFVLPEISLHIKQANSSRNLLVRQQRNSRVMPAISEVPLAIDMLTEIKSQFIIEHSNGTRAMWIIQHEIAKVDVMKEARTKCQVMRWLASTRVQRER